MNFNNKLQHSIDLLKKSERLALQYSDKGFYLAFSGGKDSQALYHVAKLAEVKFEAHYSITTLDPPELVHFIRHNYPDVINDRPELTFQRLCISKKALPTKIMRFCCAEMKEPKGAGAVTLTGVRKQESLQRSKRNEAEIVTNRKKDRFSGTYKQFDEFTRTKEVENVQCVGGKDKIVINPIIEWTDKDVWYFLNEVVKVEHCELYDRGWKRIGCLFCPMASKRHILHEKKLYPKYYSRLLRIIHELRKVGYMNKYADLTDEEIAAWWISKKGIREWYADNKLQGKLF